MNWSLDAISHSGKAVHFDSPSPGLMGPDQLPGLDRWQPVPDLSVVPLLALPPWLMNQLYSNNEKLPDALSFFQVQCRGWLPIGQQQYQTEICDGQWKTRGHGKSVVTGELRHCFQPTPEPMSPLPETEVNVYTDSLSENSVAQCVNYAHRGDRGVTTWIDLRQLPPATHGQIVSPALVESIFHGVPWNQPAVWDSRIPADHLVLPALISELNISSVEKLVDVCAKRSAVMRCELRSTGNYGSWEFPVFRAQLILDEQVLVWTKFVGACWQRSALRHAINSALRPDQTRTRESN